MPGFDVVAHAPVDGLYNAVALVILDPKSWIASCNVLVNTLLAMCTYSNPIQKLILRPNDGAQAGDNETAISSVSYCVRCWTMNKSNPHQLLSPHTTAAAAAARWQSTTLLLVLLLA